MGGSRSRKQTFGVAELLAEIDQSRASCLLYLELDIFMRFGLTWLG